MEMEEFSEQKYYNAQGDLIKTKIFDKDGFLHSINNKPAIIQEETDSIYRSETWYNHGEYLYVIIYDSDNNIKFTDKGD